MADFCQQCLLNIFGGDTGDLAGLSTPEDTAKGLYPVVLCEGCGPTQVDDRGKCVAPDCLEKHGAPHPINPLFRG